MPNKAASSPVARNEPQGRNHSAAALPEMEVTVTIRQGDEIMAVERFTAPMAITSSQAKLWANALAQRFIKSVQRAIGVWMERTRD